MEVYPTLAAAVSQLTPDDKRRVYSVHLTPFTAAESAKSGERFVLAASPASAALAVIGDDNVSLVSQRERYNAALSALMAKQDGKAAK